MAVVENQWRLLQELNEAGTTVLQSMSYYDPTAPPAPAPSCCTLDPPHSVPVALASIKCAAHDRCLSLVGLVAAFVDAWEPQRSIMETHEAFVDAALIEALVDTLLSPAVPNDFTWSVLKMSSLLARSDANSTSFLRAGGASAALSYLCSTGLPAGHLEVGLALLLNLAYSSEGVSSILEASGVPAVLTSMREHTECNAVQRNGLGVLWNLCDSDEHWVAFLREGSSLVSVLLCTLAHHRDDRRVEESVIDLLWDFSSTGDGQAHIISGGGVAPILEVLASSRHIHIHMHIRTGAGLLATYTYTYAHAHR